MLIAAVFIRYGCQKKSINNIVAYPNIVSKKPLLMRSKSCEWLSKKSRMKFGYAVSREFWTRKKQKNYFLKNDLKKQAVGFYDMSKGDTVWKKKGWASSVMFMTEKTMSPYCFS